MSVQTVSPVGVDNSGLDRVVVLEEGPVRCFLGTEKSLLSHRSPIDSLIAHAQGLLVDIETLSQRLPNVAIRYSQETLVEVDNSLRALLLLTGGKDLLTFEFDSPQLMEILSGEENEQLRNLLKRRTSINEFRLEPVLRGCAAE